MLAVDGKAFEDEEWRAVLPAADESEGRALDMVDAREGELAISPSSLMIRPLAV